jgi:hypothetical protein
LSLSSGRENRTADAGVSRMYGRVIETADKKNLKKFMSENIHKDALIRTDGWTGYKGLEIEFPNLRREKSEKKVGRPMPKELSATAS